jgi:general secretion pathway protein G
MNKKGFTLIELMVVIALIGILSSVILASLTTVKERNRDAKRVSDIREIEKALSLYQISNNSFPVPADPSGEIILTGTDEISELLEDGGHISEAPTDPQHPATSYTYQTNSQGGTFILSFCLETNTIKSFAQGCGNTIEP